MPPWPPPPLNILALPLCPQDMDPMPPSHLSNPLCRSQSLHSDSALKTCLGHRPHPSLCFLPPTILTLLQCPQDVTPVPPSPLLTLPQHLMSLCSRKALKISL
ncbi:hypothetical protein O181_000004 [Austropuccinia psidii MF-1]|uniref:Uncharacterized protein n=1 Tax=Austropuccinia psidii MF-1 TaxID=1389203 RepID=A0A9Q3B7U7_9BASI|nr:hypothetical protein [Austropuccinia psidii MF-1]